jgi:AcrR family transcriptional regulator
MSPRAGLDRARVVQAAADLVNAEGPGALTLARLANELEVQPPSLFNHVHGMPDLLHELRLLNVRLLGERMAEAGIGKSGPEAAQAVMQAYRAYIKENPGLYLLDLRASGFQAEQDKDLQSAEERVVQVAMAVVESFGLQAEDGLHAVRGLRSLVHGFATLEVSGGFGLPLDLDESFRRIVTAYIRGLQGRA